MKHLNRILLLSLILWWMLIFLTLGCSWSDSSPGSGQVKGRITDANGTPLSTVRVSVYGYNDEFYSFTDNEGMFYITGVPSGVRTIKAEKQNYNSSIKDITIANVITVASANFILTKVK